MKALSIRQPWAHLIVHGPKRIENRTWRCHYRGEIAIHASKGVSRAEHLDAVNVVVAYGLPAVIPPFRAYPLGAIVEVAWIVG